MEPEPLDALVRGIDSLGEKMRKQKIRDIADLLGSEHSKNAVFVLSALAKSGLHQKSNKIEIARATIHAARNPEARKDAGIVLREVLAVAEARNALVGVIHSRQRGLWSVTVLEQNAKISAKVLPNFLGEKNKKVQAVVKFALTRDNIAGHARQRLLEALADPNKRGLALEILTHPNHANYLPRAIRLLRERNRALAAIATRVLKSNKLKNKRIK